MAAVDTLAQLLERVIVAMGYELVGVEYHPNSKRALLRIYIDKPQGITVDDCALVSHQISGVLDVEDPLPGEYNLEVSSPGLDRPLFKVSDYERFAGETIRVRLRGLLDGRRKFRGILRGLQDGCVRIEENGAEVQVPLEQVDKANLELQT